MRLLNHTLTLSLKRKTREPVRYERIDENNVRIGCKWLKMTSKVVWSNGVMTIINGVTIFNGKEKRFIANSWFEDIDTDKL